MTKFFLSAFNLDTGELETLKTPYDSYEDAANAIEQQKDGRWYQVQKLTASPVAE